MELPCPSMSAASLLCSLSVCTCAMHCVCSVKPQATGNRHAFPLRPSSLPTRRVRTHAAVHRKWVDDGLVTRDTVFTIYFKVFHNRTMKYLHDYSISVKNKRLLLASTATVHCKMGRSNSTNNFQGHDVCNNDHNKVT